MSTNRISVVIPPAVMQIVLDALQTVNEALAPYVHPITDEQRKGLVKMGDKSLGFIQDVVQYGTSTPALVPSFVDMNLLKQDVQATTDLDQIHNLLVQTSTDVASTKVQVASQALSTGLLVYDNTKTAVKARVPGAQVAMDEMGKRFDRPSTGKKLKKDA